MNQDDFLNQLICCWILLTAICFWTSAFVPTKVGTDEMRLLDTHHVGDMEGSITL